MSVSRQEEFMQKYIVAEPKLRAYALACGLKLEQVDDLAQQAALVLWRRFGDYDPSCPFLPWALGVAGHLVQETRRAGTENRRLLSPVVAEQIARTCTDMEDAIDARRRALRGCVEKLPPKYLELLDLRYGQRLSLGELANRLNKGISAVNMALHRMRQLLLDCVQREGVA